MIQWCYDSNYIGRSATPERGPDERVIRRPENLRNRCWNKLAEKVASLLNTAEAGMQTGAPANREQVLEAKIRTLRNTIVTGIEVESRLQKEITRLEEDVRRLCEKNAQDVVAVLSQPGAWAKWTGGPCPLVDLTQRVEIMTRDSSTQIDKAGVWYWDWDKEPRAGDIVRWRLAA